MALLGVWYPIGSVSIRTTVRKYGSPLRGPKGPERCTRESKEVYKRQVLSITSIAMAISLLGTLCMALYCRNKRRREKLQAHIKESRVLKNYSGHAANTLEAKARAPATNIQMHKAPPPPPPR
ncbi:unnamed protein product [Merluccius merluccius]